MVKRWLLVMALMLIAGTARAQFDPCGSPSYTKMSFQAAVSATAGTTELIAAVKGKNIHLCGLYIVGTGGTTPTWQLKVGTKATNPCDTNGATVTPAFPASTSAPGTAAQIGFYGGEILNTGEYALGSGVSSSELCLVAGGTTPTLSVYGTFVQSAP